MAHSSALSFQEAFHKALFDDPMDLYEVSEHSAETFNRRLNIYRTNVFSSLEEVLASTYPHVQNALGQEVFHQVAMAFIRAHPPQKALLSTYGDTFPAFLVHRGEDAWVGALATLEWSLQEAYYARDTPPLTQDSLARITPDEVPRVIFHPAPSLRVFEGSPALAAYFLKEKSEGPSFYQEVGTPSPQALLTRPGFALTLSWVERPFYEFVQELAQKNTLGRTAQGHLTKYSDFDVTLALRKSFELGCFSGYILESESEEVPCLSSAQQ